MSNRRDYLDRAVTEFQKAIEADKDSLFLRVELAELYISTWGEPPTGFEMQRPFSPSTPTRLTPTACWRRSTGGASPNPRRRDNQGQHGEGNLHFEALTRLEPKETDNALVLGSLYRLNNQNDKAQESTKAS